MAQGDVKAAGLLSNEGRRSVEMCYLAVSTCSPYSYILHGVISGVISNYSVVRALFDREYWSIEICNP